MSAQPGPTSPARFAYVLGVSVAAMAGSGVCAWLHLGWVSAWVVTLGAFVALAGWAAVRRDALLGRLLAFGALAALGEVLGADRWAVQSGTLDYPPFGPFLASSPAYMVASWTVAVAQFSLLGQFLETRLPRWGAALACAAIGGTNLPFYESLAFDARWWAYQNVPMVLHAPHYVILAEVGLGLSFPWFARQVLERPRWAVAPLGALLALWMFVSGWLGRALVG